MILKKYWVVYVNIAYVEVFLTGTKIELLQFPFSSNSYMV